MNGTLMRGEVLHHNLSGCAFLRESLTTPHYRLFLMGGGSYPGMIRVTQGGAAIAGEVYEVSHAEINAIFSREPPHLYLGDVELEKGIWVPGVLCDPEATHRRPEITEFGGWRGWRKQQAAAD